MLILAIIGGGGIGGVVGGLIWATLCNDEKTREAVLQQIGHISPSYWQDTFWDGFKVGFIFGSLITVMGFAICGYLPMS